MDGWTLELHEDSAFDGDSPPMAPGDTCCCCCLVLIVVCDSAVRPDAASVLRRDPPRGQPQALQPAPDRHKVSLNALTHAFIECMLAQGDKDRDVQRVRTRWTGRGGST